METFNSNFWIAEIATLLTALGGFELIKWLVSWIATRKSTQKKVREEAEALEINNEINKIGWLENRILERDKKIDALYGELRAEQQSKLDEIHRRYSLELILKESEVKRCDVRKCSSRKPPGDY